MRHNFAPASEDQPLTTPHILNLESAIFLHPDKKHKQLLDISQCCALNSRSFTIPVGAAMAETLEEAGEQGGAGSVFKDLFSGAVGGVAQVLIGELYRGGSRLACCWLSSGNIGSALCI